MVINFSKSLVLSIYIAKNAVALLLTITSIKLSLNSYTKKNELSLSKVFHLIKAIGKLSYTLINLLSYILN